MATRWTFSVRLAISATSSVTTRHMIGVSAASFFFSANASNFSTRRPPAATSWNPSSASMTTRFCSSP
ncbi:hypothetical protein D9M71_770970 [compost metagenome]